MKTIESKWQTKPISKTCEQILPCGHACGKPTACAYEAYGGGWMALCDAHVNPHAEYVKPLPQLLAKGETLKDA